MSRLWNSSLRTWLERNWMGNSFTRSVRRRSPAKLTRTEALETRVVLSADGPVGGLLNLPPLPLPDTFNVIEGTPFNSILSVLENDGDPNNDDLTAHVGVGPLHGMLTLNLDGTFTYTPDNNFIGVDVFTYYANDGLLDSLLPVVVTLNVGALENTPPVANNDTFNVAEDSILNLSLGTILEGVLANDTDAELVPLTASLVTGPSHGTLMFLPLGTFIYTPDPGFNGTDSFTYQASDLQSLSNVATATINVSGINDAPIALNDLYSTATDTTLNVSVGAGVLANDSDADTPAANLDVDLVADVANGTLVLNNDGSFTYTPDNGFTGTDSFTYQIDDGDLLSNIATVIITVTGTPGAAPVANNDTYTLDEDGSLTTTVANGVLFNDTDADDDDLTATLVGNVTNGTLTFNADGTFVYTPDDDFSGTDSFTYQVSDGTSNSNIATVTLTVTGANDAPIGQADAYTVNEGGTLNVTTPGVLANDTDADDDDLTVAVVTGPTNGNLTLNANGSFTYTPNSLYNGTVSFTYQINDGTTTSGPITVTLTITSVNNLPLSQNDEYFMAEDGVLTVPVATGVLVNDTDADGDDLTAEIVTSPQHGTLTLNPDGSLVYTPDADYFGTDSFTYRANDGTQIGNVATVTINIEGSGEAPILTTSVGNKTTKKHKKLVLDPQIDLTDADSENFNGGHLNVAITNGIGKKDSLGYRHGGAKKGFVNVKRNQLRVGTTVIGTVAGGKKGTPLLVEFGANATQERVEIALQSLIFRGTGKQPGPRVVSWQITDETGLDSNVATNTVDVT